MLRGRPCALDGQALKSHLRRRGRRQNEHGDPWLSLRARRVCQGGVGWDVRGTGPHGCRNAGGPVPVEPLSAVAVPGDDLLPAGVAHSAPRCMRLSVGGESAAFGSGAALDAAGVRVGVAYGSTGVEPAALTQEESDGCVTSCEVRLARVVLGNTVAACIPYVSDHGSGCLVVGVARGRVRGGPPAAPTLRGCMWGGRTGGVSLC